MSATAGTQRVRVSSPTHVLILPSWYPDHPADAGGSFFREQALALQRAGVQVGVLAPRMTSVRPLLRGVWPRGGHVTEADGPLQTVRLRQPAWFPRIHAMNERLLVRSALRAFETYVKAQGRPDLLHAHSLLPAGQIARAIRAQYGVPYVVTEHSTRFPRGLLNRRQRGKAAEAALSAHSCLAVSEGLSRSMRISLGMDLPWPTLPNLVDPQFLSAPLRPVVLPTQACSFRALGSLVPKKGFDVLIRAFAKAFPDDPGVSLEIGGEGPEGSALDRLVTNLGLNERVRLVGPLAREEVPGWMRSGDALVVSSRVETFGVVVIEALALGLPVVATRSGGPESIVVAADGLLVPPGDVSALAQAMAQMRSSRPDYPPQELRDRCARRFGETVVIGQLLEVYREVLTGAPGGGKSPK
jgi:glycosyltransferase involved in cell wall biosynthesis